MQYQHLGNFLVALRERARRGKAVRGRGGGSPSLADGSVRWLGGGYALQGLRALASPVPLVVEA